MSAAPIFFPPLKTSEWSAELLTTQLTSHTEYPSCPYSSPVTPLLPRHDRPRPSDRRQHAPGTALPRPSGSPSYSSLLCIVNVIILFVTTLSLRVHLRSIWRRGTSQAAGPYLATVACPLDWSKQIITLVALPPYTNALPTRFTGSVKRAIVSSMR